MNVYLLRHGACEKMETGVEDSGRKLTADGKKAIEDSLTGMRELTGQVEYMFTSPFSRAIETANILGNYFKCMHFIETIPALAERGADSLKAVDKLLNKIIGKENIVVVGHVPHLEELVQYFVGDSMEDSIKLKKGGMAKIHFKGFPGPGKGMLRWVMTSDELKKTGKENGGS